jgi:hypothetical protein
MIGFAFTLVYETKLTTDEFPIFGSFMDPAKPIVEVQKWSCREGLIANDPVGIARHNDLHFIFVQRPDLDLFTFKIGDYHLIFLGCHGVSKVTHMTEHVSCRLLL